MLSKLIIRNYAIIDNVTLEPDAHLNTVTGETGAGKSIIIGALSLILGERADTSVLINKNEKCFVEGYFDVKNNKKFEDALTEEGLDHEEQCIIRREISSAGKSRAFVNDTPVNLMVLNKLTSLLVDLHRQFDTLELETDTFQINVLDALAQNGDLNKKYNSLFIDFKKTSKELSEKQSQLAAWQKESDYKQFLLDELTQASFKENEIEEAEQQLKQMSHAEKILTVLQQARMILDEGEQPLINELRRISQQLQGIADVMTGVGELQERINSSFAELKDIAAELEGLERKVNIDPARMQQLQDRVDIGYKLLKKHGVQTTSELLLIQERLQQELKSTFELGDVIEQLTKQKEVVYKELHNIAENLSKQRNKVAPQIAIRVNELLSLVGMPNAQFRIELKKMQELSEFGTDEVDFLLDANKSGQFLPLQKAASGGEMSRIMLCIKSLTAKAMQLPTLIFDEVDSGISGEAARQVGVLLKDLGKYHQVICITHQPQVAAKGSKHFYVYKDSDNGARITTRVKVLQREERIMAIARMIGGEKPSDAALQNARELVV